MEDRRTAIAVLLCTMVVLVYSEWVFAPYKNQQVLSATQSVSQGASTQQPVAPTATLPPVIGQAPVSTSSQPRFGHPNPLELSKSQVTQIETSKFSAKITHLGARFTEFLLRDYFKTLEKTDLLNMVATTENGVLPLAVISGGASDDYVNYSVTVPENSAQPVGGKLSLSAGQHASLIFTGLMPNGSQITKTFVIDGDSYLIGIDVSLSAIPADGSRSWLEWSYYEPVAKHDQRFDYKGFTLLSENKLVHVPVDKVEDSKDMGNASWSAFTDMYFMAALIPATSGANVKIGKEENVYLNRVAGEPGGGKFRLFVGPKEFKTLEKVGYDLHRTIDLGWFSFLAHPLLALLRLYHSFFNNWGLAIVLLTLTIKALFLPLTRKSFESMKAMQAIQPELKALQERIKDPTQRNNEVVALYKKHGVNPFGGCLPMFIQLPVFVGLYNSLLYSIEIRHAPFALWIHDLSSPERLHIFGMAIPVMVILMGISMFLQQWLTPSQGMDPAQRKMMLVMPVVFTFLFLGFPAGLTLYWLVNNLISIVQQVYIKGEKEIHPGIATLVASIGIFGFAFILTLI